MSERISGSGNKINCRAEDYGKRILNRKIQGEYKIQKKPEKHQMKKLPEELLIFSP